MGFPDKTRWFIIRVLTTSTGLEASAPAKPHAKLELQKNTECRLTTAVVTAQLKTDFKNSLNLHEMC